MVSTFKEIHGIKTRLTPTWKDIATCSWLFPLTPPHYVCHTFPTKDTNYYEGIDLLGKGVPDRIIITAVGSVPSNWRTTNESVVFLLGESILTNGGGMLPCGFIHARTR